LASAYAGWAGSFRSDIVEERLRRSLEVSRLPAVEFVDTIELYECNMIDELAPRLVHRSYR
jgi:hypothetical protein